MFRQLFFVLERGRVGAVVSNTLEVACFVFGRKYRTSRLVTRFMNLAPGDWDRAEEHANGETDARPWRERGERRNARQRRRGAALLTKRGGEEGD